MKRILSLLLACLTLVLASGCDANSKPIKVLAGSGYSCGCPYVSAWSEFYDYDRSTASKEAQHEGETKTLEMYGTEITLTYMYTHYYPARQRTCYYYVTSADNQMIAVELNKETGRVEKLLFTVFPEDAVLRTEQVTLEQAKDIARGYMNEYYPEYSSDEYVFTWERDIDENNRRYQFELSYFVNGIKSRVFVIYLDENGNIVFFSYEDYMFKDGPESLKLTEEDFLAGAKSRIDEFYADFVEVAEIKDMEIYGDLKSMYLHELGRCGIDYSVHFTVVHTDGSEIEGMHQFFYPYGKTTYAQEE